MRFFLAEDDEDVRFVSKVLILVAFSFAHLRGFANGRLALDEFARTGADLVVCDHDLPVLDGADLTRALRTLQPALPTLMVSGNLEARELGAPVGISILLDKDLVRGGLIKKIESLFQVNGDHLLSFLLLVCDRCQAGADMWKAR